MNDQNKMRELFDSIYLSKEGTGGSFGSANRLYDKAKLKNKAVRRTDVDQYLATIQGYSRHARVVRRFPKRSFLALYPFEFFQIDIIYLSDLKTISRQKTKNKLNYGFSCIDTWSKIGFCKAMTRKRPSDSLKAFQSILHEIKKQPVMVLKDAGKEFEGEFASWCKSQGIILYSTSTLQKAALCENFNYQLKLILNRILTHYNTNDWPKFLELSVKIYNNQKSKSLANHSPLETLKPKNQSAVQMFHLKKRATLAQKILKARPQPKFKVGDTVRKIEFSGSGSLQNRGFKPRFSKAIYTIKSISTSLPRGYFIGLYKNKIPQFFYANELRRAVEIESDNPSVLHILNSREKVKSYLRNGKVREKEIQYLTVIDNNDKPKYLNKSQILQFKNGSTQLKSFSQQNG